MTNLQEKLKNLAAEVAKIGHGQSQETTPVEPARVERWAEGQSGATVNWEDYNLDANQVRLYRRAKYHEGQWLFPYVHYTTINKPVGQAAQELENMVNEGEWKIVASQPNGAGMIVFLLTKTTVHPLETPQAFTDIVPLDEPETDNSAAWVEEQKGT